MESPGLLEQQKSHIDQDRPLSQDGKAAQFYINQINKARDQRFVWRTEFDDMTYNQDYEYNQLTANSYLRRKKNDDDVRVNTGTAEKKVELILNELLAMNIQAEVRAFDEDDLEARELGEDMTDIVERTNEIERDDDMYMEAYLELLTQRAVFVEEFYGPLQSTAVTTGKKSKFTERKYCQKRLLSGLQVFLGDMTLPASRFNEQPYICKYDRVLYSEAEVTWGDNENWKYVRPGQPMQDSYGLWFKYRAGDVNNDQVEIITYMSTGPGEGGEYQVMVNGVMMYEVGTKLPWKHYGYNISMTVIKPISPFFAYGKSPLSSAKALQGLADETIRNLVRKMRQAIDPPLGVASGKVYSKDIWSPGNITQGLLPGSFTPLIQHQGITPSEFQMYQTINQEIEKFVGQYGVQQTPGAGTPTATQIIEEQKQSLKMLGLAILGAMRLKRDMTYLRLWGIIENYFEAKGKKSGPDGLIDAFRSFSIENSDLGDGISGKKIIALSNKSMSKKELMDMDAMEMQAIDSGEPFRYKQINVSKLEEYPLTWYVVTSSHERESGALDKVLFQDKLNQAAGINKLTGRQLSGDKVIDSFEHAWKAKGWFEQKSPPDQTGIAGVGAPNVQPGAPQSPPGASNPLSALFGGQGAQAAPGGQSVLGSQMLPQTPNKPSVNSLVNA